MARPSATGCEQTFTADALPARARRKASRSRRKGGIQPQRRLQATGFRLQASGDRLQATGYRLQASGDSPRPRSRPRSRPRPRPRPRIFIFSGEPKAHVRLRLNPSSSFQTSKIFPGFRILLGSRARFMARHMSRYCSETNVRMYFLRLCPMPCSPESIPPRAAVIS